MTTTTRADRADRPAILYPGTAITARPWCDGRPMRQPCWGVILQPWGSDQRDWLVWFPTCGHPDEPGRALQPILAHEVETARSLTARPPTWVRDTYDALRRAGTLATTPHTLRLAYDTALCHHAH